MPRLSKELNAVWRFGFGLAAIAAWITLIWGLAGPSESASAFLLGYSAERLMLAAVALLLALLFSWFAWRSWADGAWLYGFNSRIEIVLRPAALFWSVVSLAIALFLFGWAFFFLPVERASNFLGASSLYLNRLRPLLFLGILLGSLGSG